MSYLYLKALHLIAMVMWFAGLFYLPRLFVYHAMSDDAIGKARFCIMERKLFIMTCIGAVLTLAFGLALIMQNPSVMRMGWLHAKLSLVIGLLAYMGYCFYLMHQFKANKNTRSHVWYRWFNEAPTIALLAIILLAVLKPF